MPSAQLGLSSGMICHHIRGIHLKSRTLLLIGGATVIAVVILIGMTLVLVPESEPHFEVAIDFMNAAGTGDDAAALPLLSDDLQAYVAQNCPDGSVSACILGYTPPEWGQLVRDGAAVYRRSIPDEGAWDIQLVATYEEGQGFAGVCIYHRTEEVQPGDWRVTAWAGFISCDAPDSGLASLRQPTAPNRVP